MHVSSRCQRLVNHPSCPLSPTTLSYARWWEGRSIWGNVVNLSRNYARLVLEWAPADKRHVASAAVRWAMAAPHVLRGHIHQMKAESYRVSGAPAALNAAYGWFVSRCPAERCLHSIVQGQASQRTHSAMYCRRRLHISFTPMSWHFSPNGPIRPAVAPEP